MIAFINRLALISLFIRFFVDLKKKKIKLLTQLFYFLIIVFSTCFYN